MAFTRGRCTNFDYCSIAESRRDVEVRVGEDFVCPECGKPLKAPQIKSGGSFPVVPVLIGVGVLAVAGGAAFLGMRMASTPHTDAPARVAEVTPAQPVPAPSAVAPAPPAQTGAPPAPNAGAPASIVAAPAPAAPALPPENILARLSAPRDLGANLIAPLASAYLGQIGDSSVTTSEHNGEIRVTGMRGTVHESILIGVDGVAAGFAALAKGDTDAVASPRRLLPAEQNALGALGDMTSPQAEHALGLGAEAVIVNPANPVAALTREQLRDVLAGTIRDWSYLGATAGPIAVYAGPAAADIGVPGGVPQASAPGARHEPNDQALAQAVAADRGGIGLVDLSQIGQARVVPIADTGATPASPTDHAAIVADDYPLAYKLYLYTSPKAEDGFARRFVDFSLSPAGQEIVEQHGAVSATLKPPAPPAPLTQADKLKAFVAGAKRLAIAFRFQPHSFVLDQYGERDLDRVMNYLVSIHDGGDHLLLAGFADNQGDPATNTSLSEKRAQAVAALFERRGLKPGKVAGFGAELPVADNATEAGRERNRRVEVYIKP